MMNSDGGDPPVATIGLVTSTAYPEASGVGKIAHLLLVRSYVTRM